MTWITEDPSATLWIAAFCGIGLLIAFYQTGRGLFLGLLVAVAIITTGFVLLEQYLVTDIERVEHSLYALADGLENDDTDAVLALVAPNATQLRHEVSVSMNSFYCSTAKIGNLKIQINDLTSPPSAQATFLGRLDVETKKIGGPMSAGSGTPFRKTVAGRFELNFQLHNDRWLLAGYKRK